MRLLVTGGTGLIGSNVLRAARVRDDVELIATVFSRKAPDWWDFPTVHMDLENLESVRQAVNDTRPEAVIHLGAVRDEDRLEVDHEWGWNVMVTSTEAMARECRALGARLVFASSCWCFGNNGRPPYSESSPPCPMMYFGLLKTVGETLVRSICENYAVTRFPGVQGINWSAQDYNLDYSTEGIGWGSLANYHYYRLSRGLPVVVWSEFYNQVDNPILAGDLASLLLHVAAGPWTGTYHLCGRNSITRMEMAQFVADTFGFDEGLIRMAAPDEMDPRQMEGKLPAPRDTRMRYSWTQKQLGVEIPGIRAGLARWKAEVEEATGKAQAS